MLPRILVRPPRARVASVPTPLRRHYARQRVMKPDHVDPELDPSFAALMNDVDMSLKSKRADGSYAPPADYTPSSPHEQPTLEEGEESHVGRAARRSPAAILGTKNIGMITLPDWLVEGVREAIEEVDNRRIVRDSYLELLQPKPKQRDRKDSRNTPEHALARAAAFLPAQYASTANVLSELQMRMGDIKGPILEVSDGIGPGLWAATEELGIDAVREYTLIQRTRFGLALAERLAAPLGPDVNLDEMSFKRDIVLAELPEPPQIALSTYMLSMLPTPQSRRDHLKQLLETGAEHIVLIDLGSTEAWEGMKAARTYLMQQSTPENPLHITAPCPHQDTCPKAEGREACSFIQKLQRPGFLRRTKHAKRGDEDITYSYLIVSRGKRPSASTKVGRFGGVAAEAAARQAAKDAARPELREVEGGEGGLEMVNIGSGELPQAESLEDEELLGQLRAEAYSWPRLVAPPLKRSGHVVMDMCSAAGQLERRRYAKSAGKQIYYDARRAAWGDLFPHDSKGKVEVRKRGVRFLTKLMSEEEIAAAERAEAKAEKAAIAAAKLASATCTTPEPPQEIEPKPTKRQKAEAFESTGDAELDAMYRELGIKPIVAVPELGEGEELDEEDAIIDHIFGGVAPESQVEAAPMPKSRRAQRQLKAEMEEPRRGRRRRSNYDPHFKSKREYSTSTRPFSTSRPSVSGTGLGAGLGRRFMSARPAELKGRPKLTVGSLHKQHAAGVPISVLTAYDYPTSRLCASADVDIILVGDSLAQVALGHTSTTELTLAEMAHHVRAVRRGSGSSFVLVDLPFGSFESSVEAGVLSAVELVKAGADAVKIEGGPETLPLVKRLTSFGIAVMPHIGLMPQRAASTGYRVQGKQASGALALVELAQEFEAAGAFALLLEAIPHQLGGLITSRVGIPTIGIGAGNQTSGQVLVLTDMLGTYGFDDETKVPKFVREYATSGVTAQDAVRRYVADVRDRNFPATGKETYTMPEAELAELRRLADVNEVD